MTPMLRPLVRFVPLVLALAATSPITAHARSFRVSDLPNGAVRNCANCHLDAPGNPRNDFGTDAQSSLEPGVAVGVAHVVWSELCPLDSDDDGWTNGEELGDPECLWIRGDADPLADVVYNPGSATSHPPPVCGNGRLEEGEDCEGGDVAGTTCADVGAGEGALACGADCLFDASACSTPPAGVGGAGAGGDASSGGSGVGGGDDLASDDGGCATTRAPSRARRLDVLGVVALASVAALGRRRDRRARTLR
jgi:hypothetical protein